MALRPLLGHKIKDRLLQNKYLRNMKKQFYSPKLKKQAVQLTYLREI